MLPENRISTHTGEILLEEFINPLELSQVALAAHISVLLRSCAASMEFHRKLPGCFPKPLALPLNFR